jgi:hypothetical protein
MKLLRLGRNALLLLALIGLCSQMGCAFINEHKEITLPCIAGILLLIATWIKGL